MRFPRRGLVCTRCPSTPQSALASALSARDSSARVCAAAALGRAAPPCPLVGDVRGTAPAARLVASPLPVIFLGGDRISPFGGGRLRSCSPSPFPLLRLKVSSWCWFNHPLSKIYSGTCLYRCMDCRFDLYCKWTNYICIAWLGT